MIQKYLFIFFGYFLLSLNCAEEVPNFLAGLDQNKTMAFYAIESGLNLSKNDIIQRKAEWAATLPVENRIAFEKFTSLANQAKLQHLNTVSNNNRLSPEANAVKAKIENILNDRTISRSGEIAAIENILSQSSPSIDAELIDIPSSNLSNDVIMQNQIIQNADKNNNFNQQQPPRPRSPQQQQQKEQLQQQLQQQQQQKPSHFSSIGDIYRASASFAPQKASIYQGR